MELQKFVFIFFWIGCDSSPNVDRMSDYDENRRQHTVYARQMANRKGATRLRYAENGMSKFLICFKSRHGDFPPLKSFKQILLSNSHSRKKGQES